MTPSAISVLEKGWMLTGAFWLLTAIGQKRIVYVESAEAYARHGLAALAAFLLLLAPWTAVGPLGWQVTPQWHWMDLAGLASGVAGFAVAFWARTLLGGEWSSSVALKTEHRLITIDRSVCLAASPDLLRAAAGHAGYGHSRQPVAHVHRRSGRVLCLLVQVAAGREAAAASNGSTVRAVSAAHAGHDPGPAVGWPGIRG
jgi:hypothetical protein